MKRNLFLLACFAFVAFSGVLHASGIRSGQSVTVDEPVEKNLHVAGGKVTIQAPIGGDLICAGGEIRINQAVARDVLAVGGDIELNKASGEDVRLVGGNIRVTDNVPGDLIITGGEVVIESAVTIGGDLIIAGGKVSMFGTVKGNVEAAAGELILHGPVEGTLTAKGGIVEIGGRVGGASKLSAEHIRLGSGAQFGADVRYWQKSGQLDFGSALVGGANAVLDDALKLQYTEWKNKSRLFVKKISPAVILYRFASGALLIGLIVAFFSAFFERIAGGTQRDLGKYFGVGTLYLIGIPVVMGITAITIVGIPAAFAIGGIYGATLSVAGALTAIVGAYGLEKRMGRDWSRGQIMMVALGLYVGLKALAAFPLVGSLAVFALTAIAFGFLIQAIRGKVQQEAAPSAEPVVEDMV